MLVARFVEVEWAAAVFEHATAMASMPAKSENKSKEQYVALRWKGDNHVASLVALCTRHDKKPELVITAMTSIAPRHVLITLGLEKGRQFKRLTLIRKWEPALVEENLIPGWVKTECTGGEDVLVRCESNWKALIAFVPLEEVLEIEFKDGAMDVATAALKAAIADVAAPKTPAQRDTMLSSVTRRSLADETLFQSLSPLERIQNASRQVQGDKLDQIRALEENLEAATRNYSMEKESRKGVTRLLDTIEAPIRKLGSSLLGSEYLKVEVDGQLEEVNGQEGRVAKLVLYYAKMMDKVQKDLKETLKDWKEDWKEATATIAERDRRITALENLIDRSISQLKKTKSDYDGPFILEELIRKHLEATRDERGAYAKRVAQLNKQVEDLCAERDATRNEAQTYRGTIVALEKQLAEARKAYPARWDGLASREKMKEMRALYLKEMRADDANQQGPSPPSA